MLPEPLPLGTWSPHPVLAPEEDSSACWSAWPPDGGLGKPAGALAPSVLPGHFPPGSLGGSSRKLLPGEMRQRLALFWEVALVSGIGTSGACSHLDVEAEGGCIFRDMF